MLEAVVEADLVLHCPGNDDVLVPGEEPLRPRFIPGTVRAAPSRHSQYPLRRDLDGGARRGAWNFPRPTSLSPIPWSVMVHPYEVLLSIRMAGIRDPVAPIARLVEVAVYDSGHPPRPNETL